MFRCVLCSTRSKTENTKTTFCVYTQFEKNYQVRRRTSREFGKLTWNYIREQAGGMKWGGKVHREVFFCSDISFGCPSIMKKFLTTFFSFFFYFSNHNKITPETMVFFQLLRHYNVKASLWRLFSFLLLFFLLMRQLICMHEMMRNLYTFANLNTNIFIFIFFFLVGSLLLIFFVRKPSIGVAVYLVRRKRKFYMSFNLTISLSSFVCELNVNV